MTAGKATPGSGTTPANVTTPGSNGNGSGNGAAAATRGNIPYIHPPIVRPQYEGTIESDFPTLWAEFEKTRATPESHRRGRPGITVERYFTTAGEHPFDAIDWDRRSANITSGTGEVIFEQKDVEVPAAWSQLATNVVVSKYFRGAPDTPERETSVKQLIERVARTITSWGIKDGYFRSLPDAEIFYEELLHLLVNQMVCFNSPVWFNVGVEAHPQCSACFINSVDDTMESILELAKTEGMLFKYGSGAGVNLSTIRSSRERLTVGGWASGPVSFMRGYDAFAGVIKSGGKTRRAAKMQILNVDHPDVMDFINAKPNEEKKAWALIEQGYDPDFNGEAYGSVFFQNANLSVRATDDFMRAVEADGEWHTRAVATRGNSRKGDVVETHSAREIMRAIADGTYVCGDPGMQFDDTINDWNPCLNTDRIVASNPCSEYMFLDDTACNLASINLVKFKRKGRQFDVEGYRRCVRTTITAMDIIVDNASYPTPQIGRNSFDFRPLGLGYANLGAMLMSFGIPYDSDEGRSWAGMVTALMTGEAYRTSAALSRDIGAFKYFEDNRDRFLHVIDKHRSACESLASTVAEHHHDLPRDLVTAALESWDGAYEIGRDHGIRNAQASVLAPTGTIAFMMDCDTTGIEPDIALVKYKKLVGGGMLKIVNNTVPEALEHLGYSAAEIADINNYIDEHETIEGAPHINEDHLPVFDCAFKPMNGVRSIHYMGHLRMMGAAQPFLSGAISKTVNLPQHCSVDDIEQAYIEAWKLGLKAVAIYRDGSKRTQPLNTSNNSDGTTTATTSATEAQVIIKNAERRRLPDERASVTHKFSVGGHEGYITVGLYPDTGLPGEIFVKMAKEGSVVSGLIDAFATSTSIMLQYGVPLQVLVDKFSHSRFEPSGLTGNRQIPMAKSVLDYIFRWLSLKFLQTEEPVSAAAATLAAKSATPPATPSKATRDISFHGKHEISEADRKKLTTTDTTTNTTAGATDNTPGTTTPDATDTPDTSDTASDTNATTTPASDTTAPGAGPGTDTEKYDAQLRDMLNSQPNERITFKAQTDSPPCHVCGSMMVRNGSCYKCMNCGATSGCS